MIARQQVAVSLLGWSLMPHIIDCLMNRCVQVAIGPACRARGRGRPRQGVRMFAGDIEDGDSRPCAGGRPGVCSQTITEISAPDRSPD